MAIENLFRDLASVRIKPETGMSAQSKDVISDDEMKWPVQHGV